MYDLLMKVSAGALCEQAADRRYRGAVPAVMANLRSATPGRIPPQPDCTCHRTTQPPTRAPS
jgi:hypothetical protein